MQTDRQAVDSTRKPRSRAAKPTTRPVAKSIKTAVTLTPEQMRRLVIFAAMTGQTQSQVVAELIDSHCRRFVVQDRDRSRVVLEGFTDQATDEVSAAA